MEMESLRSSQDSSHEMRFTLREMLRQKINQQRKERRDADLVGRREIEECPYGVEKLNPADIEALATRIKKKQGGKENRNKDLYSLQVALSFSGEVNGKTFAKVDGAIAALVRDLSGQDSSLQLRATYCCANLSLAGTEVGLKVAKAVTPYLMNHLQGMNQILLEASLWAVGSLAGSGMPAYKVLEVQGVYPQLSTIIHRYHLPTSVGSPSQEKTQVKLQENRVIEAVLYAAAHCVSVGLPNNPKPCEIEALAVASIPLLNRADPNALPRLAYLFFVLTCSEASDNVFLRSDFLLKMLLLLDETLIVVIDGQNNFSNQGFAVQVITFVIRVLGNLCSSDNGRLQLENISPLVCPIISRLMKTLTNLPSHIMKETLWFAIQLVKPYSEWNNGYIQVCDSPWTSLTHMVNLSLEQQSKRISISNFNFPLGTVL